MKTKNIILLILGFSSVALIGYWLGSRNDTTIKQTDHDMTTMESSPAQSGTQANSDKEVLYWQSPMNPTEIYDKPGKSRMGMDLVPVYADGSGSSEGAISINPVVVQNMNVRLVNASLQDLATTVRTVGKIEYNEQKLFNVNTKITGWVEELFVDYTGKEVEKGQPLFSIYSPELVTTQQEYLLALDANNKVSSSSFTTIREGGISLLEATKKRLQYWDIPDTEIQRLQQSGEVNKSIILNSPATGVILHKNAVEGELINAGSSAYQIADLSSIWVIASVYDYELPWIKVGQTAEMELSYQPGEKYIGKITYIYPDVDERTRTIKIRLEFPNPDRILKPGMFTNVRVRTQVKENVLTVPNEAIIRTGQRNIVFVANGNGTFEPREVTLGIEGGPSNNDIEVITGLETGESIVTSAQFLLDSESRLQEAIQKMLNQGKNQEAADMETMDHSVPMETDQTMNDTDAMSSDHEMSADTTDHSNMDM